MKTKDLIKELQLADASGELEVSVGNTPIHFVERLEGYYDGIQQVLITDGYKTIGAKYNVNNHKVTLHTLSIADMLWGNPDLPVDYSELSPERQEEYKKIHDKIRNRSKEITYNIELEHFTKHIKKRALEIESDLSDLEWTCKDFFAKNLSPKDPLLPWQQTKDGSWESYNDRRERQWNQQIELIYDGYWHLTKKEQ